MWIWECMVDAGCSMVFFRSFYLESEYANGDVFSAAVYVK